MPILIFDGDCGFCRRWIEWLKGKTGDKVQYAPYQEVASKYPQLSTTAFKEAVQLIDENGHVSAGAEAFFKTLKISGQSFLYWGYRKIPGFSFISEFFYQRVARHRTFFSFLSTLLYGNDLKPESYYLVRWLFIKSIALIYLTAFVSFAIQAKGLVGQNGIIPNLIVTDAWLLTYCWAGALFSVLLLLGFFSVFCAFMTWFLYLQIVYLGSVFMQFQWDALLLEAGFLTILLVPRGFLSKTQWNLPPNKILIWLYRWLLFRLMFSSALAKWTSGDLTWRNLTALGFHYETQPLPTWVAWYAQHLPAYIHRLSTGMVFFIEGLVPFLFFLPRRPRYLAFWLQFGFQIIIFITGNYTFFNLLTMALCLFLLDDGYLKSIFPKKFLSRFDFTKTFSKRRIETAVLSIFALAVVSVGVFRIKNFFGMNPDSFFYRTIRPIFAVTQPFELVNSYGLFAVMTIARNELVIEGSQDKKTWLPYRFRWKPEELNQAPRFVAPYQPRLDWQMWFASLASFENQIWLHNLLYRILQGEPEVLALLGANPFPEKPPKYLRVMSYQYHFSSGEEHREKGLWWTRALIGPYSPTVSIEVKN